MGNDIQEKSTHSSFSLITKLLSSTLHLVCNLSHFLFYTEMHTSTQDLGRKFSSMALKKTHYKHYLVTNYTLTQHSSAMINVLLAKEKKMSLPA